VTQPRGRAVIWKNYYRHVTPEEAEKFWGRKADNGSAGCGSSEIVPK
jgi:hypothetical protein